MTKDEMAAILDEDAIRTLMDQAETVAYDYIREQLHADKAQTQVAENWTSLGMSLKLHPRGTLEALNALSIGLSD